MISFKAFVSDNISYFVQHFKSGASLLDVDGTPLMEIDLSFQRLTDEYLSLESSIAQEPATLDRAKTQDQLSSAMRINDSDLDQFWQNLDEEYEGDFRISDQNITDQTVFKLANLLSQEKCKFRSIYLDNNKNITAIAVESLASALRMNSYVKKLGFKGICLSKGANRIIQLVQLSRNIYEYDFGVIGNDSLLYLAKQLYGTHVVQHISFGEESGNQWKDTGKVQLDKALRTNPFNKQLISVTMHPEQPQDHYDFIAQISILCAKNRELKVKERENDFKSKSLNPQHPKYYDPDNHGLNAYKFSVKSYLNNVFGSMLDQGLYFLEKQRRNSLREEAVFNVTRIPINKKILEDICTSEGSIMVLTQYLLNKVRS